MNKVERDKCEKLINEANKNIYEAREQWANLRRIKKENEQ